MNSFISWPRAGGKTTLLAAISKLEMQLKQREKIIWKVELQNVSGKDGKPDTANLSIFTSLPKVIYIGVSLERLMGWGQRRKLLDDLLEMIKKETGK
ncbi:MAG: hypothetical protein WC476_01480 [Phycisphaerae bacterium]